MPFHHDVRPIANLLSNVYIITLYVLLKEPQTGKRCRSIVYAKYHIFIELPYMFS